MCQVTCKTRNILLFLPLFSGVLSVLPLGNHIRQKNLLFSRSFFFGMLDSKDIEILRILQQDARLTTKEVATRINLSVTPVYERIRRLERNGYIERYVAILNAEKLNQGFVVFCSVKLRQINNTIARDFAEFVRNIPEVTECYNISGAFDYLLKVHCPNMKYYQKLVLEVLGRLDTLAHIESTFVMESVKQEYGVDILHAPL